MAVDSKSEIFPARSALVFQGALSSISDGTFFLLCQCQERLCVRLVFARWTKVGNTARSCRISENFRIKFYMLLGVFATHVNEVVVFSEINSRNCHMNHLCMPYFRKSRLVFLKNSERGGKKLKIASMFRKFINMRSETGPDNFFSIHDLWPAMRKCFMVCGWC